MNLLYKIYTELMGRPSTAYFNTVLLRAALHGLGVFNVEPRYSGERWLVRRRLRLGERPILFDVGANVGEFSRLLVDSFPTAEIHAFEPHPANFSKLSECSEIRAHNLALGDSQGTLKLFDFSGAEKGSTFASVHREVFENIHGAESHFTTVRVTTLDAFCREHEIPQIDFLKIDTEGNELAILRGSTGLLQEGRILNLLFEFNEMNTVSRVFMRDFVEMLKDYQMFRLLPNAMLPVPNATVLREIFAYQNIFCMLKT